MPNNKETEGPIFNSEDKKQNISKSLIFPGNRTKWGQIKLMWRGLLISLWKWMIYIYHIFREMKLKSKGDCDIAYSAVMDIGFNAYSRKFIVF